MNLNRRKPVEANEKPAASYDGCEDQRAVEEPLSSWSSSPGPSLATPVSAQSALPYACEVVDCRVSFLLAEDAINCTYSFFLESKSEANPVCIDAISISLSLLIFFLYWRCACCACASCFTAAASVSVVRTLFTRIGGRASGGQHQSWRKRKQWPNYL